MTTSAPARAHASSARAPSSEKPPSASCRSDASRTQQRAVEIQVDAAQRGAHGDLVWTAMAVVRDIQPWDELLRAGREDERLVMQSAQNRRPGRAVAAARRSCIPSVREALPPRGIERLYSHQAEALHAAWAGPTIVTTGTASGKSMCFQLPTLDVLCRDSKARALYLYPSKALAQDQARALHAFGVERVRQAIYDGDTPREQRSAIRRRANVVLTNPDMLHLGILPNHRAWGDFFANLALVVVDEAHVYRGVFGSHVGNVLRRLRRVARRLRDRAAVRARQRHDRQPGRAGRAADGPRRLHRRSTGTARPAATRTIAMWNPPITDEKLATRRSRARRGGRPARRARLRGRAHDRVHEVAQGRRADGAVRDARARGHGPRRPRRADRALPRGLHRRSSGASSSAGSSRASCSGSSPPTRSSSASTSARSTPRSA